MYDDVKCLHGNSVHACLHVKSAWHGSISVLDSDGHDVCMQLLENQRHDGDTSNTTVYLSVLYKLWPGIAIHCASLCC